MVRHDILNDILSVEPVLCDHLCCCRLENGYEESRGSYISQLEMYSLYLVTSTRAGHLNTLTNTDFNTLLR